MDSQYTINISWDEVANVWIAICDALPLALESDSYDALIERIKIVAGEMLELNAHAPQHNMLIKSERLVACG